MFVGCIRTMERRGRGYQLIRTAPPVYSAALRWAGPTDHDRRKWAGLVSAERGRWAGPANPARYNGSAHFSTTSDSKRPRTHDQEDRTLIPTIPAPSQGVSLPRITDKDFLITCLTRQIEYLHISKGLSAPKRASSARSADLLHEPAICCDWPESAKVLRHHRKNKLRMLTHRWKRLGIQDPVGGNRNDYTPEQSHRKNQLAMETDSLLKITPIKASQAAAQSENGETNGLHCLSLNISGVGLSKGKVSDKHSSFNMSGSSECHTDSDLSDQEQESTEMSKWAAAMELELKPEPFDEDLDLDCLSTETAFYPEVLPASLKVLDSTQSLSSEIQQSLFVSDPCLAPVIARLTELERLQAATVQKERAKLARSQPATANTRNGNRLRKSDLPGCKTGISRDVESNSVMCSFTKLMVCPNSSCRCRPHTCPSTKSGQGSRSKLLHSTLPKHPDNLSGRCKKAETVLPAFSVSMKVPQKPTVPNRTKSPHTQRDSTSAKKATVPNRKT
ncbi:uncharacterized protein LOC113540392 [Pangasianodon hypophthalmus]|uniref:uncharacterized protein LOC113540392 n=1 Tax=Pangasianodon hypophthalmus TaxID=310915 RepID=UPI002307A595|nr:uncharacterized protein LOC113540392 [Pangasianodon hypophthalmus]XP_053089056.1 uncharacterized protein LOC113540392 [Pangasianodon hypophthalmus]